MLGFKGLQSNMHNTLRICFKLKSCETSFVYNNLCNEQIFMKFCTEQGFKIDAPYLSKSEGTY